MGRGLEADGSSTDVWVPLSAAMAMAGWPSCCSLPGQGGLDVGPPVGFGGEQVNDEGEAHIILAPALSRKA